MNKASTRVFAAKIDPERGAYQQIFRSVLAFSGLEPPASCTVVQAPAGYGKTSLLRQWHRQHRQLGYLSAWYRCGQQDNEPGIFLTGIFQALKVALAAHETPLPISTDSVPDQIDVEQVVELIEAVGRPGFLLLDDFHMIDALEVKDVVARILDLASEKSHLVLSGRRKPTVPLSHLAASGRLRWFDASDLRFDIPETRQFFSDQLGFDIDPFDIEVILKETLGWPAGLGHVANILKRTRPARGDIASAAGLNLDIARHFDDCVMSSLDAETGCSLTQLAILDRLERTACVAVLGRQKAQQVFTRLSQGDLFASARDLRGDVYELHPLFHAFLLARLEHSEFTVEDLHRRAGDHYAGHQRWIPAVKHALASGETGKALAWAEKCAVDEIGKGDPVIVAQWLGSISTEELRDAHTLFAALGIAYALSQRVEDARRIASALHELVEEQEGSGQAAQLSVHLKILQLCIAYMSDDIPLMLGLAERFYNDRDKDDHWPRLNVSNALIHGNLLAGKIDKARQFEQIGQDEIDDPSALFSAAYQSCLVGLCDVAQIKLLDAEQRFRAAYVLAEAKSGRMTAVTALCASLLAAVRYERNDLEEAENLIVGRLELIEQTGFVEALQGCYLTLSRIYAARGEWKIAHSILNRGSVFARKHGLVRLRGTCLVERIDLACRQRQVGTAQTFLTELGWLSSLGSCDPRSTAAFVRQLHILSTGLIAIASRRMDTACSILKQYVSASAWDDFSQLRARLPLAVALQATGRFREAQEQMEEALLAGARGAIIRSFLDAGMAARALARLVLARLLSNAKAGDDLAYFQTLLSALSDPQEPGAATAPAAEAGPAVAVANLTGREQELLAYISRGFTNQNIADELGIGLETVKWHLKNVFGKLKVKNRAEAVACVVGTPRASVPRTGA